MKGSPEKIKPSNQRKPETPLVVVHPPPHPHPHHPVDQDHHLHHHHPHLVGPAVEAAVALRRLRRR
jgi:hypothetical protein